MIVPHKWSIAVIGDQNMTPMLNKAVEIAEELLAERVHQWEKFGDQSDRTPQEYFMILMEEVGEWAQDLNKLMWAEDLTPEQAKALADNFRKEMIQVAAVAMAAVAAWDKALKEAQA